MISEKTASRIWNCYREIENGEKLIDEMEKALKNREDPNPRDAFGRQNNLQLGVPCSRDKGHTLYSVEPKLAISVIRAHVANQRAELAEANEQARIELDLKAV